MSGFVNLPQISGPKTVILSVDFRSGFGVKYRCINIDVPHRTPKRFLRPVLLLSAIPETHEETSVRTARPSGEEEDAPHATARTRGALFGTPPL